MIVFVATLPSHTPIQAPSQSGDWDATGDRVGAGTACAVVGDSDVADAGAGSSLATRKPNTSQAAHGSAPERAPALKRKRSTEFHEPPRLTLASQRAFSRAVPLTGAST
jgi:hypothetical protein